VPPPKTVDDIEKRSVHQEWVHKDFYLALKDIAAKKEEPAKPVAEASKPAEPSTAERENPPTPVAPPTS